MLPFRVYYCTFEVLGMYAREENNLYDIVVWNNVQ